MQTMFGDLGVKINLQKKSEAGRPICVKVTIARYLMTYHCIRNVPLCNNELIFRTERSEK